ncbi:hypothetical protein P7H17_01835 [Paenibacillus larvae]|nr:hypothetical protein [Paenibacillus larvae]MDT2236934.1 hypothetical protein [Paenibacillus larvae]MDT2241910.1 hypothetical protein [Paenibacillus larvae]MDT2254891.1 hypothetical protein [Paenibacillus larvae]MDT2285100.1 hypothetical protein [Paenibacillus larvae]
MAFFAKLYKNKWLDPDFPMNNNSAFAQKIEEGKIGLFSATWYDTRGPIDKNIEKEPHAEWIPLEYPTGKKGRREFTPLFRSNLIRSSLLTANMGKQSFEC